MEIFKGIVQGTPEWRQARLGIPTASMFKTVMATGKGGGESKTRTEYLHKLAGEIITGEPMTSFTNGYMERGHELEPVVRDLYAMITDCEPVQVGFIRNGKKGCSPDSLIGDDGMLEIKTAEAHILIEKLEKPDHLPPEHKAQTQGNLLVAGRDWIDLVVYCRPSLPMFKLRTWRDEGYIQAMVTEIDRFNAELADLVERIRRIGVAA